MEQRQVGRTGLRVSHLGLGTLTWSRDTDEHEAREQLRDFVDAGGTLVDTSASYADGGAEELIGSLLGDVVSREDVVLCTKAGVRRTAGGGVVDASRGGLLNTLDASLARLRTDHVDLWLVQTPDPRTPLTETISALRLAVTSGRARYVGLSNHAGWQVARAATLMADDVGLAAVEAEYSLLQRGIEREVLPAAADLGVGLLAWSPLGRGVLTGKYRRTIPADSRAASPHLAGFVEPYLGADSLAVVEAVAIAAQGLDRSPLDVALAWLRVRAQVSSAIVGARTAAQLRASLAAEDVQLPPEILRALDEVSAPELGYPERR
ncbi:aldo/keto reductase [Cellulomonas chengniuliangii]|uniref:Aldo/keto reductase n=1 Tax=Cellulomonas chengniuliangii TaxID=2968084 RepID=A0ABY5L1A2_9CELL|nr:aldo/keto reductase [Cellulomonas chengniuliangii]MCC2308163.1 aldo/keto reductase [Cellulomonas chengniuliangii]MCC2317170.1 aldo/keto reductase [Cellulomonas chengniuliangii]UUI76557.1 aldo/keto reductase [Cellulomonas chengniuliangii]